MVRIRDVVLMTTMAFIFFVILSFSLLFGERALPMAGVFAKYVLGMAEAEDFLNILTECKNKNYEFCADLAADKVMERYPNHKVALGHVAVRLTKERDFDKASSFYAAYFSQSGSSAEVNYWYAQLLLEEGQEEKAIRWSYLAVLQDPDNEMYSKALHELLVEMDKSVEALALIGFVTKGRPQEHLYWSAEFARLEQVSTDLEKLMKQDLSVPIRGQEAYVPVVETTNKKLRFFKFIGRECTDCPESMDTSSARVVSRLEHNFLVLNQ